MAKTKVSFEFEDVILQELIEANAEMIKIPIAKGLPQYTPAEWLRICTKEYFKNIIMSKRRRQAETAAIAASSAATPLPNDVIQ